MAVGLTPTTTCTSKTSRSTKSSVPLFTTFGGGVPLFVIRPYYIIQYWCERKGGGKQEGSIYLILEKPGDVEVGALCSTLAGLPVAFARYMMIFVALRNRSARHTPRHLVLGQLSLVNPSEPFRASISVATPGDSCSPRTYEYSGDLVTSQNRRSWLHHTLIYSGQSVAFSIGGTCRFDRSYLSPEVLPDNLVRALK